MPDHWVHHQLTSGRAIVLVDGVDELPQSQRLGAREWLKDLAETYKEARFIASSRPHAVEEGWMEREGFDDAELQPMELTDIFAFIDHWHDAVREVLRDDLEKDELTSLADHLKEVVRHSRPLHSLAINPLLCAMLCALHRDRRQQLPSDRIELYEAGCQMLLERRDIERRIALRDYPHLSYRQKRALLQDFAYWLLSNGWSEVTYEAADGHLAIKLGHMEGLTRGVTSSDVRRLFIERSGMLREPAPRSIDFTHRTFQEFLAAQAALDEGDLGVLVRNAHDDQWREVIVLAAGLASVKAREELIKGLIARGDQENQRRHHLHLLAVACLETSIELGPSVKEEVQKCLAKLVPPKNLTEAKALASAGELAVPYLVKSPQYSAPVAAACVRTLALIGSDAALEAIETYLS
jgi:predicted NACHT family NTPase